MNSLGKIAMIYLFLAISISLWNPAIIFGNNTYESTFLSLFPNQIAFNSTSNELYLPGGTSTKWEFDSTTNQSVSGLMTPPNLGSGGSSFLNYADPILMVIGFFSILIKFIFSPILFLTVTGAPITFILMIGVPLTILFLLALLSFIRSGF